MFKPETVLVPFCTVLVKPETVLVTFCSVLGFFVLGARGTTYCIALFSPSFAERGAGLATERLKAPGPAWFCREKPTCKPLTPMHLSGRLGRLGLRAFYEHS